MDLTIVSAPALAGIDVQVFREERVMVSLPSDHELAEREMLSMVELREQAFISYPASHGSKVREAMTRLSDEARFLQSTVQEAPDLNSLLAIVGTGVGDRYRRGVLTAHPH